MYVQNSLLAFLAKTCLLTRLWLTQCVDFYGAPWFSLGQLNNRHWVGGFPARPGAQGQPWLTLNSRKTSKELWAKNWHCRSIWQIAVGVKIIDKISIYRRSCLMWVYTCCLLLVSTYLYRYVLCFLFPFVLRCCSCREFSAPSGRKGKGKKKKNSAPRPAHSHGKYPPIPQEKHYLTLNCSISGRFYFRQIHLVFLMGAANISKNLLRVRNA